jgi:hypothetical protein
MSGSPDVGLTAEEITAKQFYQAKHAAAKDGIEIEAAMPPSQSSIGAGADKNSNENYGEKEGFAGRTIAVWLLYLPLIFCFGMCYTEMGYGATTFKGVFCLACFFVVAFSVLFAEAPSTPRSASPSAARPRPAPPQAHLRALSARRPEPFARHVLEVRRGGVRCALRVVHVRHQRVARRVLADPPDDNLFPGGAGDRHRGDDVLPERPLRAPRARPRGHPAL